MKTKLITILLAISVSSAFTQIDSLTFKKDIDKLNSKISELESKVNNLSFKEDINELSNKVSSLERELENNQLNNHSVLQANDSLKKTQSALRMNYKRLSNDFYNYKIQSKSKIDSIQNLINTNSANIDKTSNELGVKIEITEKSTNQSISDLNKTVSQNTLYWIIAIMAVALFVLLIFILLRKQIFKQKSDLESDLQNTRKALEEEGVKLDNKLIEVLESQLKIINNANSIENKEVDHTLALNVGDEIIRIQKNLTRMDEKTKGLKQLSASVKRIQYNFASNGYELVEMIGQRYDEGMHVTANFVPDDYLKKGERIITRIIKPQVNYNGVMIQQAQIEVSQG